MGLFPKRQSKQKNPPAKAKKDDKKPLLPFGKPKVRKPEMKKTRKKILGIFGKGK